jgi:hypothetical protein
MTNANVRTEILKHVFNLSLETVLLPIGLYFLQINMIATMPTFLT